MVCGRCIRHGRWARLFIAPQLAMRANVALKQKQAIWEAPRNLVIVNSTMVVASADIAGVEGSKLDQNPPPQNISVHLDAPLVVQLGRPT